MAITVKEKNTVPQELYGSKVTFCLNKISQYEWDILQVTLHDGKVADVKHSPASAFDVTIARFLDLIRRGDTIETAF